MKNTDKTRPKQGRGQKKPKVQPGKKKESLEKRQRPEMTLQASEEKFRRLFETAQDGILLLDAVTGVITEANPFIEKLLGYSHLELIGKKLWEIGPFKDMLASQVAFGELQKKKYIRYENLPLETKDGRRIEVEFISNVYSVKHFELIQCSIRDVTERKQAEEVIRKLNEAVVERTAELEAANKELEAFSYSISHDLRSPLRAMDGFSRILLEEYTAQLPAEARRYLGLVRDNAQQMGHLIEDLLAFSRLSRQPLNKQTVAMADVVRQALAELCPRQAEWNVEITIGDPSAGSGQVLPACEADPALLKQVWVNLLSNALKFTRKREDAHIEIGAKQIDGECIYYVKDNGVGFDMQYANKLFGVFQRLHRAEEYEGTGVGLAIVQRIVYRHGGRIWAEAEADKGAAFYFTLGGGTR